MIIVRENRRLGEKIYECEVKKLFIRNGIKRMEWVCVSVRDALEPVS